MNKSQARSLGFSGWQGSLIVLLILLISEIIFPFFGNLGSFLYVTFHFFVVPILSVIVLARTRLSLKNSSNKISLFISMFVPIIFLYATIINTTLLPQMIDKIRQRS